MRSSSAAAIGTVATTMRRSPSPAAGERARAPPVRSSAPLSRRCQRRRKPGHIGGAITVRLGSGANTRWPRPLAASGAGAARSSPHRRARGAADACRSCSPTTSGGARTDGAPDAGNSTDAGPSHRTGRSSVPPAVARRRGACCLPPDANCTPALEARGQGWLQLGRRARRCRSSISRTAFRIRPTRATRSAASITCGISRHRTTCICWPSRTAARTCSGRRRCASFCRTVTLIPVGHAAAIARGGVQLLLGGSFSEGYFGVRRHVARGAPRGGGAAARPGLGLLGRHGAVRRGDSGAAAHRRPGRRRLGEVARVRAPRSARRSPGRTRSRPGACPLRAAGGVGRRSRAAGLRSRGGLSAPGRADGAGAGGDRGRRCRLFIGPPPGRRRARIRCCCSSARSTTGPTSMRCCSSCATCYRWCARSCRASCSPPSATVPRPALRRAMRRAGRRACDWRRRCPTCGPICDGATVFVAPLRFGRGVKNKVLEAMAMRRAGGGEPGGRATAWPCAT